MKKRAARRKKAGDAGARPIKHKKQPLEFLTHEKPSRPAQHSSSDAFSRPVQAHARSVTVDLPALVDPPVCQCWSPTAVEAHWAPPASWSPAIFAAISGKAVINGAKACMCCLPQSDIPKGQHRKMHISLNNGEIRIDVPILETVADSDTPMYTQHVYCTKCRKFEQKHLTPNQPNSPIVWSCCSP